MSIVSKVTNCFFDCYEAVGGDDDGNITVVGRIEYLGNRYDVGIDLKHCETTANTWEATGFNVIDVDTGNELFDTDIEVEVLMEISRAVGYFELYYTNESRNSVIYHK